MRGLFDQLFGAVAPDREERAHPSRPAARRRQPERFDTPRSGQPRPPVFGPGALIGGGGATLSEPDRAQAERFGSVAANAARGGSQGPQFTDAPRPQDSLVTGPGGVLPRDPIADAVTATGAPEHYIRQLVQHESGGRADARASTSSATGHAQFVDGTWLAMLHRYGPRYGPEGQWAAERIERTSDGYRVRGTAQDRQRVLDLRFNPGWSAVMAAHYGQENAAALSARLGRRVNEGEVYLGHFLGERDAARLIRAATHGTRGRGRGAEPATAFVSREAVSANRNIFFDRAGNPRSAREVYELQTRRFGRGMWPERAAEATR